VKKEMRRIIYIAPHKSSFVMKDIDLLQSHFRVKFQAFSGKGVLAVLRGAMKQIFFLARNLPFSAGIIVMFGGYHAFLPSLLGRIFRKKVAIILGGTDCVSFPSINYGTFRKGIQAKVTCASYRLANLLLPVHHSLMLREDTYYTVDSRFQGCQYWCPGLRTPFRELHNGYRAYPFDPDAQRKDPRRFTTIAFIEDPYRISLKGIDMILSLAKEMPECSFTIIGLQSQQVGLNPGANVTILPFLEHQELFRHLAMSRFYLQLSISEGFPNSLCEAMLMECVPVGSQVGGIPDIIGDAGFLVSSRSVSELKRTVEKAMAEDNLDALGRRSRERIKELFPLEKRERGLLDVFSPS
jgi:glycosyltransferase involved in cell wall biosynthesis